MTSVLVISGVIIILYNLHNNIIYFYPPSEIPSSAGGSKIRIGGLVKDESVKIIDEETVEFIITDYKSEIMVRANNQLPALFREGQGVIAEGWLQKNVEGDGIYFNAHLLLTKHDENYKPPNVP